MTNPETTGAERAPKPDHPPVPQTEGEAILNRHQDKAVKESAIYKAMTEGECPEPFCRNGIMGAGITRRSCPVCRAQQKADEGTGLEGEDK